MLLCQQISGQSLAPRAPWGGKCKAPPLNHSPRSTTPEKQRPIRSSLSRIQLTASCPALDTPCSPADFSVSVPRIATCWGPPGASWSPHFSLLTPEEKRSNWDSTCARRAMDRESHCGGSGAGLSPAEIPGQATCQRVWTILGVLLQEPKRAKYRTNLFIQRVCWQNYIPCQGGDLFQISLRGKKNYFEYRGGIDLD